MPARVNLVSLAAVRGGGVRGAVNLEAGRAARPWAAGSWVPGMPVFGCWIGRGWLRRGRRTRRAAVLAVLACGLAAGCTAAGAPAPAGSRARFEVEGADMAVPVLTLHGVTEEDVDRVWEAIALHATMGIASRRGLLTHLTHVGVMIEIGRADALPAELVRAVHEALPRDPNDTSVRDAIIRHASRSEAARPPFSISAELHRLSSSSRDGFVDGP